MIESLLLHTLIQWNQPEITAPAPKPSTEQRINAKGLKIVKFYEGLHLKPYYCPSGKLSIGYGHTGKKAREGHSITPAEADALLAQDMREHEGVVKQNVIVPLTSNQFSALVSFSFNVGDGNFKRSTLVKKLNEKDYTGAVREFRRWTHGNGGQVLGGLVYRRTAEIHLFMEQDDAGI